MVANGYRKEGLVMSLLMIVEENLDRREAELQATLMIQLMLIWMCWRGW